MDYEIAMSLAHDGEFVERAAWNGDRYVRHASGMACFYQIDSDGNSQYPYYPTRDDKDADDWRIKSMDEVQV